MLGVQAALGRTFRPDEEEPGKERVVLLTDGLWRRRYGADPAIVGQSLRVDGQPFTVIGVRRRRSRARRVRRSDTPSALVQECKVPVFR